MIEYQYDEKTFRKMILRVNIVMYAVIFGIFAVLAGLGIGYTLAKYLNGASDLGTMLMAMCFIVLVLVALIVVWIVSTRKQLSKSFSMFSVNGIVHEKVDLTDEEIIVTNSTSGNVYKMKRSEIASVKNYKEFFAVTTTAKAKWFAPLNEQTVELYNALTHKSDSAQISLEAVKTEKNDNEAKANGEQAVEATQSDALSFIYEITEQSAVSMLTKILTVRFRIVLAAAIILTVFAVGGGAAMLIGKYALGTDVETAYAYLLAVAAALAVFFWVGYGLKGKNGEKSGKAYFAGGEKDGVFLLRVELYEQGIVVINEPRDVRTKYRIADMEKIRMCDDFFYVEFKSKVVLPVPLTEDTRRLYDILNNCIK